MTRSKSLPIRSSRKSLDPYPSPASLPEEANQRAGGSGVSNKRYALQIESGDDDVEIVTDTFDGRRDVPPHKKRHCLGESETDRGGSQPLNLDACIVCENSDEFVSRCSGSDCIISFHEECLDAELGSGDGEEDPATLYCPYCWFKILALRSIRLKEEAVGAEMAVFKYLDKEIGSLCEVDESVLKGQEDAVDTTDIVSGQELEGEKTAYSSKVKLGEKTAEMAVFKYLDKEMGSLCEVNESVPKGQEDAMDTTDIVSDQELEGEKTAYSLKEKQVQVDEKDCDESRGENMELIEENNQSEADKENVEVDTDKPEDMKEDKVVEEVEGSNDVERAAATENFQDAEDDKVDETGEDQTKANPGGGKEGDVSLFLSMQESFSAKEHDQVQQNEKRRRKRRLILNAFDSDVSSNGSTNEPNGEDAAEKMTSLALVVTSPLRKNQQREHSRTTEMDNSKTARDISFFKKDQKRRQLWTPEEEHMLKVGVDKFQAEAKKNIPWRKILEMGQKVFHETRTPADLKDKWRNITGSRLGKKNKQDSTSMISGM